MEENEGRINRKKEKELQKAEMEAIQQSQQSWINTIADSGLGFYGCSSLMLWLVSVVYLRIDPAWPLKVSQFSVFVISTTRSVILNGYRRGKIKDLVLELVIALADSGLGFYGRFSLLVWLVSVVYIWILRFSQFSGVSTGKINFALALVIASSLTLFRVKTISWPLILLTSFYLVWGKDVKWASPWQPGGTGPRPRVVRSLSTTPKLKLKGSIIEEVASSKPEPDPTLRRVSSISAQLGGSVTEEARQGWTRPGPKRLYPISVPAQFELRGSVTEEAGPSRSTSLWAYQYLQDLRRSWPKVHGKEEEKETFLSENVQPLIPQLASPDPIFFDPDPISSAAMIQYDKTNPDPIFFDAEATIEKTVSGEAIITSPSSSYHNKAVTAAEQIEEEKITDIILQKEGYVSECILYCSLFPADYEFTRDTLIRSWIAARLVGSEQNDDVEAVAITCFDTLIRSQYILQCGYDHSGNQMKYKLSSDKNLFLDKQSPGLRYKSGRDSNTDTTELEHLSLIFEEIDQIYFENILIKCSHLKTLLLHQCRGLKLENLLNDLFLNLKLLTSLDLSGTNIMELPNSIENLEALRYLDMSNTPIRRLPESLDSLNSLETLILLGCLNLCGLPRCMNKLINMRHLVLDIARQLQSMPMEIGKLRNLQTLKTFLVGTKVGNRISELRNMDKLKRSLQILRLENVLDKDEAAEALLHNKQHLKKLELAWSDFQDAKAIIEEEILKSLRPHFGLEELKIVSYSGGTLPSWISDPHFTKIVSISLYRCKYCETLPSLGKLPSLKFLNIVEMDSLVHIDRLKEDEHAFRRLKKISFDGMANLEDWTGVKDGDFPCLKELMIKYCPKLVSIPTLSYLISLQHLEISYCPELSCLPEGGLPVSLQCLMLKNCPKLKERCCNKQGEDWIKVAAVPALYIDNKRIDQSNA